MLLLHNGSEYKVPSREARIGTEGDGMWPKEDRGPAGPPLASVGPWLTSAMWCEGHTPYIVSPWWTFVCFPVSWIKHVTYIPSGKLQTQQVWGVRCVWGSTGEEWRVPSQGELWGDNTWLVEGEWRECQQRTGWDIHEDSVEKTWWWGWWEASVSKLKGKSL